LAVQSRCLRPCARLLAGARLLIALAITAIALAAQVVPAAAALPVPTAAASASSATGAATVSGPSEDAGPLGRLVREVAGEVQRWWELGLAGYAVRAVLAVVGLLGGFLADLLHPVCCGPLNFVTRTPPELSYANPAVVALWGTFRTVANAALALVALWGGLGLMARRPLGDAHLEVSAVLPRLAVGALLANTSLWWTALAVDLNNGLCALVGSSNPFPGWDRLTVLDRASTDGIALLAYGVVGVLLVLQQAGRLALIDLLLAVAPLALLCWVLPQTQRWAALWSTVFARTVYVQFLQTVALKLGAALLAAWAAGSGSPLPDALSVLLGVAVLGLALRLPRLLQTHVTGGLDVARYYALRAGTRALEGSLSGRGGVAPLPPPARAADAAASARRR
jgi:hypothetical protein